MLRLGAAAETTAGMGVKEMETIAHLIGRTRAVLLSGLAEPSSTTGLAARCGVPVSSVSEHLAVLRAAGLVSTSRTGRFLLHQRTALGIALSGAATTPDSAPV